MTPSEEIQDRDRRLTPGGWIGVGLLITLIGGLVALGAGDVGWLVLTAAPGAVMLWIGVIAKGVEVGLRSARSGE